eukprot:11460092-Alexandrium_andersonii.AAC.1
MVARQRLRACGQSARPGDVHEHVHTSVVAGLLRGIHAHSARACPGAPMWPGVTVLAGERSRSAELPPVCG